ncbi:MAG: acyl-ACP--UDP-N-acetylglucosamine O-acyltransferase [Truepera sp.]|nr:acyl-ACP--UDP-N-acetylglucosamine O-acyltransferase [Truepera sp.]
MAQLHPSAVIDPRAELAPDVLVGPLVVIEADVVVGAGSVLNAGTVLLRGSRLAEGCRIGPYAVIGGEPMDTNFRGETSQVVLERGVQVREFTNIHRATGEGQYTRLGEEALVMSHVHVSHNCQVGRGATLVDGVKLAGHCEVGDYAFVSANVGVHQFGRVGAYAIVGGWSGVRQDILPFSMANGNPVKHYRLNRVGLMRRGITGARYEGLERALRAFRRRDWAMLEELAQKSTDVRLMLAFKHSSRRGLAGFAG